MARRQPRSPRMVFLWLLLTPFLLLSSQVHAVNHVVVLPLIHHEQLQQRQRQRQRLEHAHNLRRASTTSSFSPNDTPLEIDPLYQGWGSHYVDLWLGCPVPQRQTVVVDTGSSLTAVPCNACPPAMNCSLFSSSRHVDPNYDPQQSSCFEFAKCSDNDKKPLLGTCQNAYGKMDTTTHFDPYYQIHASYADGSSWSGHVARDQASTKGSHDLPTNDAFAPFYFGCQETVQGLESLQVANGILGMDRTKSSYWHQWVASQSQQAQSQQHQLPLIPESSQFSLCFVLRPSGQQEGAGAMVLGGTEPRLDKHPMVYAQMLRDDTFHVVWIERIYLRKNGGTSVATIGNSSQVEAVQGRPADFNRGPVIIDSGSTGFRFSPALEPPFRAAWRKLMGYEYNPSERSYSETDLANLPTILIQLSARDDKSNSVDPKQPGRSGRDNLDPNNPGSVVVALSPQHFMRYISSRNTRASQLVFSVQEGEHQSLGSYMLAGHNVHFDVKHERIGFAESDCDMGALGDANSDHTPYQDTGPPSNQLAKEENLLEKEGAGQGFDDGWACGGMSCGTALIVFLVLGAILLVFAVLRCCSRRSTNFIPKPIRGEEAFTNAPYQDDHENGQDGDSSDEEEENYELSPIT